MTIADEGGRGHSFFEYHWQRGEGPRAPSNLADVIREQPLSPLSTMSASSGRALPGGRPAQHAATGRQEDMLAQFGITINMRFCGVRAPHLSGDP